MDESEIDLATNRKAPEKGACQRPVRRHVRSSGSRMSLRSPAGMLGSVALYPPV